MAISSILAKLFSRGLLGVIVGFSCWRTTVARGNDYQVGHVIHISVDGLRGSVIDELGPTQLPNFFRIQAEGAYTNNARTLYENTVTMPNHVSMITGRRRDGADGHGVFRNSNPSDPNITVHSDKGQYVTSVFDIVHDQGMSTAFYAGWNGFNFLNNSWTTASGAPDVTGADNGTDKIDTYILRTNDDQQAQMSDLIADLQTDPYTYTLLHLHRTDAQGHGNGWTSPQYLNAVRDVDFQLGRLIDFVNADPTLSGNTAIILTADHGGSGTGHSDVNNPEIYRIPFYVWIAGEQIGQDLYSSNFQTRGDPGGSAPNYDAPFQPIRNGDSGNLALDLLGLPAIPGSTINDQQDLRLRFALDEINEFFLLVDPASGAAQLRNQSGGNVAFDGYAIRSQSGALVPAFWHSLDDEDGPDNNDGGWRESNASSTQLAELYQNGSFTMANGNTFDLEEIFDPSSSFRDIQFEILLPGQSEPTSMQVIYGTVVQPIASLNTFFLLVDPVSGDVQLRNQSGTDVVLEGYILDSASGSLNPAGWQSLDDLDGPGNNDGGWRESNASPERLAELLESGNYSLMDGQAIRFGNAFDTLGGVHDLIFSYLLPGQTQAIEARVIYASLPENPDYNGDGVVNAADYTVWRDMLGAARIGLAADGDGNGIVDAEDYHVWRANFGGDGSTLDASTTSAVPEPNARMLCGFLLGFFAINCWRESNRFAPKTSGDCAVR